MGYDASKVGLLEKILAQLEELVALEEKQLRLLRKINRKLGDDDD